MNQELPEGYFLETDAEMLGYLEKQGYQALKEAHEINAKIKEKYDRVSHILIIGMACASWLAVDKAHVALIHDILLPLIVYWSMITIFVGMAFLFFPKSGLIHNAPANLYFDEVKELPFSERLILLRKAELENVDNNIKTFARANHLLGKCINYVSVAISMTPFLGLFIWLLLRAS